jgi:hypothetical protein
MTKFLSEIEAAEFLCCSVAKMQRDRRLGSKIPYVKIGRSVRYRLADLERYIEAANLHQYCAVR